MKFGLNRYTPTHVSRNMNAAIVLLLACVPILSADNNGTSLSEGTIWHRAGRMTGLLLDSCFRSLSRDVPPDQLIPDAPPEQLMALLRTCIGQRVLTALRRVSRKDVIEISEGVQLIRYREGNYTGSDRYPRIVYHQPFDAKVGWKTNFLHSVEQLLGTHVLKIRLKKFDEILEEARGRRKNMFNQMLMFGVIVASLIVIPMGFQFLAILGGKALLLSKLALILASIQGLKKIATSNLNYGLYSYGPGAHGPCKKFDGGCEDPYYDRDDKDVYFSVDIEGLDGNYDRQWQQEGYGLQNYGNIEGYADALHPRKDLLHDLQTR